MRETAKAKRSGSCAPPSPYPSSARAAIAFSNANYALAQIEKTLAVLRAALKAARAAPDGLVPEIALTPRLSLIHIWYAEPWKKTFFRAI